MTILGFILLVLGAGGGLLMFTGAASSLQPWLDKMPLGLWGWVIVAAVGIVLMVLNRRPND